MLILALNCGSSSVKFALVDVAEAGQERRLARGAVQDVGSGRAAILRLRGDGAEQSRPLAPLDHDAALGEIVRWLRQDSGVFGAIAGVGHRVVHGGERYSEPQSIDAALMAGIEQLCELAPLHNPPGLLGIRRLREALPERPQVAVFDTAFHQTLPPRAFHYALPRALHREHGVRRYGFHGSSHRHAAHEAARRLGLAGSRSAIVTAHLGSGCSIAAVADGRCVDTSMGLTPAEGLVMATRAGDVDPGLHEYLARRLGLDLAGIGELLNRRSGLLGVSGRSGDMRELESWAERGDADAALAIELFCYRLAKYVAGCLVPLGRLDALVFTGGIGENAAGVRARVIELLAPLGLQPDPGRNLADGAHSRGLVSADGPPCALVVKADEELLIARDAAEVIARATRR